LKKKQGKEKPGVTRQVDPARLGQYPVANPLTFVFFVVFFTKRTSFGLKKELTRPTRSRPGDQVKTRNSGLGPGRVLKLCLLVLEPSICVVLIQFSNYFSFIFSLIFFLEI
jgi:hypothetical protein